MGFTLLQLKVLDGEKEQKEREVAELQTRLLLEEQREEEKAKELFAVRHKLTEAETARDFLKKEVRMAWSQRARSRFPVEPCQNSSFLFQLSMTQKRLVESESSWRSGERELTAQLQEARGCEKKLQDEAKNLALRTQAAQDSAAQSSLLLSETQGRLAATEAELIRAEAGKKDLEFRLNSIQSALTRTLGIGASGRRGRGRSPGGSSTSPGTISRHQSISPLRTSLSPPKGKSEICSLQKQICLLCLLFFFRFMIIKLNVVFIVRNSSLHP